jgi:hypothetical protein
MTNIELVWVVIWLVGIAVAVLLFFYHRDFNNIFASPHEFVYGAALKSVDDLPVQVERFLSLEGMDPDKIRIQTFSGNSSGHSLGLLIKAIVARKKKSLQSLVASLEEINDLSNEKERAIKLVEALVPYSDQLRYEAKKDDLIVFIYYGLRQPADLSCGVRMQVEGYVAALDTPSQEKRFKSGKCPKNHLAGNINIYPFSLENASWHETVDMGTTADAPVLEIRFMGLKGVFKYFLGKMSKSSGCQFIQLDGGFIE